MDHSGLVVGVLWAMPWFFALEATQHQYNNDDTMYFRCGRNELIRQKRIDIFIEVVVPTPSSASTINCIILVLDNQIKHDRWRWIRANEFCTITLQVETQRVVRSNTKLFGPNWTTWGFPAQIGPLKAWTYCRPCECMKFSFDSVKFYILTPVFIFFWLHLHHWHCKRPYSCEQKSRKKSFWPPSSITKVYLSSFMCKTGYLKSLNYQIRLFLVPRLFWRVVFAWRCRNWVYKVPQLSNMFIFSPSTIKSIYFFLDSFEKWYSHDVALGQHARYMWKRDPCHVAIFFPFLILPSLSLTLLSLYLPIPIQNGRALGSSIPTATSSCGGERREKLRRAPVMEHAERYDTKGSCGRARGERKKEDIEHVGPTITCT
jgi:hypothetical protein